MAFFDSALYERELKALQDEKNFFFKFLGNGGNFLIYCNLTPKNGNNFFVS